MKIVIVVVCNMLIRLLVTIRKEALDFLLFHANLNSESLLNIVQLQYTAYLWQCSNKNNSNNTNRSHCCVYRANHPEPDSPQMPTKRDKLLLSDWAYLINFYNNCCLYFFLINILVISSTLWYTQFFVLWIVNCYILFNKY